MCQCARQIIVDKPHECGLSRHPAPSIQPTRAPFGYGGLVGNTFSNTVHHGPPTSILLPPFSRTPLPLLRARVSAFSPPMRAWLKQPHGRRHKAPPQPCALTATARRNPKTNMMLVPYTTCTTIQHTTTCILPHGTTRYATPDTHIWQHSTTTRIRLVI